MEKEGGCMAILQFEKNMEGILVVLWECNTVYVFVSQTVVDRDM